VYWTLNVADDDDDDDFCSVFCSVSFRASTEAARRSRGPGTVLDGGGKATVASLLRPGPVSRLRSALAIGTKINTRPTDCRTPWSRGDPRSAAAVAPGSGRGQAGCVLTGVPPLPSPSPARWAAAVPSVLFPDCGANLLLQAARGCGARQAVDGSAELSIRRRVAVTNRE